MNFVVRPRKPELIIRENEPKELPPDVVRGNSCDGGSVADMAAEWSSKQRNLSNSCLTVCRVHLFNTADYRFNNDTRIITLSYPRRLPLPDSFCLFLSFSPFVSSPVIFPFHRRLFGCLFNFNTFASIK